MYINLKDNKVRELDSRKSMSVYIFDGYIIRCSLLNIYLTKLRGLISKGSCKKIEEDFLSQYTGFSHSNMVTDLQLSDIQTFNWNLITCNLTPDLSNILSKRNLGMILWLKRQLKPRNKLNGTSYQLGSDGTNFLSNIKAVYSSDSSLSNLNSIGYKLFLQFMNDTTQLAVSRNRNASKIGNYLEISHNEPAYYILSIILSKDAYFLDHLKGTKSNYNRELYEELMAIGYCDVDKGITKYYRQHSSVKPISIDSNKSYILQPFFSKHETGQDSFEEIPLNIDDRHLMYIYLSGSRRYNFIVRNIFWKNLDIGNIEKYAKYPYVLFREAIYFLNNKFDFFPINDNSNVTFTLRKHEDFEKILLGDLVDGVYQDTYTLSYDGVTITKHPLRYYINSEYFKEDYWKSTTSFTHWLKKIENTPIKTQSNDLVFKGFVNNVDNFLNFSPEDIDCDLTVDDKYSLCLDILADCCLESITVPIPMDTLNYNSKLKKPFKERFFELITSVYISKPQPVRGDFYKDIQQVIDCLVENYEDILCDRNEFISNPMEDRWYRSFNTYYDIEEVKYLIDNLLARDGGFERLSDTYKPNDIIINYLKSVLLRYIYTLQNYIDQEIDKASCIEVINNYTYYYGIPLYQCAGEIAILTSITHSTSNEYEILLSIPIGDYLCIKWKRNTEVVYNYNAIRIDNNNILNIIHSENQLRIEVNFNESMFNVFL